MAANLDNKPADDLSALAWVHTELRRSLDHAGKALRRHLKEMESAARSDVDAVDTAALRSARTQLHQGVGALELVGLPAAARVLRGAEAAVQRMLARPAMVDEASVRTVERTCFALLDYLGRLLAGKRMSAVDLFAQYAAVQALAGADRVHPADLWEADFDWHELPAEPGVVARAADDASRGTMEAIVLRLMRRADASAWTRLSTLCAELAAGSSGRAAALWQLAAAFAEAEAAGLLPQGDVHTKRMAARLLAQLRLSARRQDEPSERLAQDLLFFCAHVGEGGRPTPRLDAVQRAWRLQRGAPLDYENERLGRFDPAWIAQARKRVAGAKDVWSAVAGGEPHRLPALGEQMTLLADSVNRLFPAGPQLSKVLQDTAAQVMAAGGNPPPPLAMEVATSIIYLDATLEDGDLDQPDLAARVRRLAERIEDLRGGGEPQPLEPWMEELYRRVSDRQTMGSVVHELRASLSEVEKQIDQYFRDPSQRELLIPVPGQLQAMRGVLSVLGMDQASAAVLHMRDDVDALAQTEVDPQLAARAGTFDRLADNLGALSFLIDMLSVQPALAKSLFRFDPVTGSLSAVMGRSERPSVFGSLEPAAPPPLADELRALADSVGAEPQVDHGPAFERLSQRALAADLSGLAGAVSSAQRALASSTDAQSRQAVGAGLVAAVDQLLAPPPTAEPSPAPAPLPPASTRIEDDAEMRDIFLEEAREVIEAARASLLQLADSPDDLGELTTVRRAFHTLKGSARMVGLRDYGEAAWACEQLYNARLAQSPRMDAELDAFSRDALDHLAAWTEAIAAGDAGAHRPAPIVAAAESLRVQGRRQSIDTRVAGQPEPPAASEPAPEPVPELMLDFSQPPPTAVELPVLDLPVLPEPELGSTLAERVPDLPLATDLDLDAPPAPGPAAPVFELDLGEAGEPGVEPVVPGDLADVVEVDFEAFDRAQVAELGRGPMPAAELPAAAAAFDALGIGEVTLPFDRALDEERSAAALPAFDLDLADAGAEPAPDSAEPEESDEQIKLIGDLRIPIPLFNIYLNEADELSRRLSTELAEWGVEFDRRPVSESTVALAHSLAGSSATVGYAELSTLARALEHVLLRSAALGRGTADDAALFNEAADEIRRLLHQFAAGFLKSMQPGLHDRLAAAEHRLALAAVERAEQPPTGLEDALEAAAETTAPMPALPALTPSFGALEALPEAEPMPRAAREDAFDDDEDLEAVDAIDADLFPIFEEEAEELLPQLQTRLREWMLRPADADPPSACMRTLHTFKGGARLAGAMRLGEMAHRLETAIEHLAGVAALEPGRIEPLLARADAMIAAFEGLRRPSAAALPPGTPTGAAPQPVPLDLATDLATDLAEPLAAAAAEALPQPAAEAAAPVAERPLDEQVPAAAAPIAAALPAIDWSRFSDEHAETAAAADPRPAAGSTAVRVRTGLLDRLVNHAGEVSIARARIDADVRQLQAAVDDLSDNLDRLRSQLREIELQADTQIASRIEAAKAAAQTFDPLEMDRFTRFQELTRMMAESVNDVATVQRAVQRTLQSTEDQLAAQARLTRELQDDLLRTRMVEFESLADRLYRVVRQAAKDTGKPVRLDIVGGSIEVDRGVLERMVGPFEHLLRNSVAHGIEAAEARLAAGKDAAGEIRITVTQEGNEIGVECRDDGGGLDLGRIRARAEERGLLQPGQAASDAELANLIFRPGFSTASEVTELAGRGVGLDVVRAEVNAMGGRIETASTPGQGARFKLVLPLTTAVTQVVLLRGGELQVAVPSTLVEVVRRVPADEIERAYAGGGLAVGDQLLPFFWLGGLLQHSARGPAGGRTQMVVVVRSAAQRVALHVEEVLGNQEVVVKHVGPQLARLPGLAGVTLLPSGAVALIYNPVALAALYGEAARRRAIGAPAAADAAPAQPAAAQAPLVLVVDDSLTVRRVTQRLLTREGYRVVLAKDGMEAMEKLALERPAIMLSDIEMPRMDGFDLVRNLRADPRLADLPVVMITSRIAQKHRDYAARLGVDHYLGKPYAEDELLRLVARHSGVPAPAA